MADGKRGGKKSGEVEELLPPQRGGVYPPDYGFVHHLVEQRERVYGGAGRVVDTPAVGQLDRETEAVGSRTGGGLASRTKIVRNREIRMRRMLLVEPRVPANYKLTTQVNRSGQALLADLCLRIPAVLAAKPMQVRAVPVDDDDDAQAAATRKEEWTHAVFLGSEGQRAALDQSGGTSRWRVYWDNLVNAGEGAFQLTVRSDRWSERARGYPRRRQFKDDPEDAPKTRRRTGSQKYARAVRAYKQGAVPFVHESLDPQMVYLQKDDEGVEDEAVVVAQRPYRETLAKHGLQPAPQRRRHGTIEGRPRSDGSEQSRYLPGPNGLGEPYPVHDFPTSQYQPDRVETATYYCSAKRARYLGLIPGGPVDPTKSSEAQDDPDDSADIGVWAHYVDGVLVDWGPLWGPDWHPLPVFVAPGLTTGIPDPNFESLPVPFHLIELADLIDQILTMELHVAFWSAFPPIIEEDIQGGGTLATGLTGDRVVDPEAAQRPDRESNKEQVTIEPGRYYPMKTGRTVKYLVLPPEATAHLESLYEKAKQLFDLLGVPGVFRGQGNEGQAGYAIAQLMIAAKSLYDPIIDNGTTVVGVAVKYLWWQVWRRFREGVPAFVGGEQRKDKRAGWLWLTPDDVAPGADGPGQAVPFLACTVKADPLLPTDEAQLELRGIRAVEAGMVDETSAREKYFGDVSPEKTAARILADQTMKHDMVRLAIIYRQIVRQGLLMPELAIAAMARDLQIDPALAFQQLAQLGTFTPEQQQMVEGLLQQQAQAGAGPPGGPEGGPPGQPGLPPPDAGAGPPGGPPGQPAGAMPTGGPQPIPGVPQPGLPAGPGLPEVAPPVPQAPGIRPGGVEGAAGPPPGTPAPSGGLGQNQPSLAARMQRAMTQ